LRTGNTPQLLNLDSTRIQNNFRPRPIYFTLPFELLIGSASTIITGIASGLLYAAIDQPRGEFGGLASVFFGMAIGYLIGFPTGVYLVASHDNPNLSYLAILGSSLGLTLITSGISAALTGENSNHFTRYIAGLSPIIGSLLYVHAFPPKLPSEEDIVNQMNRKINSFKDYYNSAMNFRMELMRIYF
jgi:hypothetical protein